MFSVATDFSVLHSFKKDQRFWVVGQSVLAHFNFTPTDGAYVWVSYYTPGKFNNDLSARAKSLLTTPQQINFTSSAEMRSRNISVGWKHYLKGATSIESSWSLYCYAGFGLLLGRAQNTYSTSIDTSKYNAPSNPVMGVGHFKRLTLDLGAGWEVPLGADIFLYVEGKTFIPTTEYPSKYLLVNNNAPFSAALNLGVRILFNGTY